MHQPGARVIGWKGKNQPPKRREDGDVAARGVLEVQHSWIRKGAGAGAEDGEVVAVQVDRVRHADVDAESDAWGGLDDPVCPLPP